MKKRICFYGLLILIISAILFTCKTAFKTQDTNCVKDTTDKVIPVTITNDMTTDNTTASLLKVKKSRSRSRSRSKRKRHKTHYSSGHHSSNDGTPLDKEKARLVIFIFLGVVALIAITAVGLIIWNGYKKKKNNKKDKDKPLF